MTVLTSSISAHTGSIRVDAPLLNPTYPLFYDIDTETVKVIANADTTQWEVERGVADTQAARHARSVGLVLNASPYGGGGTSEQAIYVGDDDPGAVGADNLWVQTTVGGNDEYSQIWVRNGADDGWLVISPVTNGDGETNVLIASPGDVAELNLTDSSGSYLSANTDLKINAGTKGLFINNATGVHLGTVATNPGFLYGNAIPSAGGGVAAPVGSLYLNTTSGIPYTKTAAGDTAWAAGFNATSLASFTAAAGVSLGTTSADVTLQANGGAVSIISTTAAVALSGTALTFNSNPVGTRAANVPAVATGGLVLLSDVITQLGTLQAAFNDLLAKMKASGEMVAD